MSEFAPGELPHPGHSLETAKRCIRESCDPDENDWVELTGPTSQRTGESARTAGSPTSRPPRSGRTSRHRMLSDDTIGQSITHKFNHHSPC